MRKIALALPETAEAPHFEATSFRVRGKIFATFGEAGDGAVVKFPPALQEAMVGAHPKLFAPVDGFWGRSGWTRFAIDAATQTQIENALTSAWAAVAPKKLVAAHAEKLRAK